MDIMDRLYLNDSKLKNFKADITDVSKRDGKIYVVLDRTGFYPEGGGQPPDTGAIGDTRVSYVLEEDSTIYHVVDSEPSSFKNVDCSIDWQRRFDHMQQHCGQHILSAAFQNLFDASTVGFHLGSEYVTVDIAINSLNLDEASRVESLANDVVFKNLPVKLHYPSAQELSKYKLRKAPSVQENIRLVDIEGFDISPCGGTHPGSTGEVGLIKIRKWEKVRDSVRVEFVCGMRALHDYSWKNQYINDIASLLSSKDTDTFDNIKKIVDEHRSANKDMKALKDKLLSYEAAELYNDSPVISGIHVISRSFTARDFKEISSLANKIAGLDSSIALLGLKSDKAQAIFTRSSDVDIKINELFKEVLPLINGKGGGSPTSAQGGGSDISNLDSMLESACIILKHRYLK
jgi:alanyl-tRNA synthetase